MGVLILNSLSEVRDGIRIFAIDSGCLLELWALLEIDLFPMLFLTYDLLPLSLRVLLLLLRGKVWN
jgi:hypothetical protein